MVHWNQMEEKILRQMSKINGLRLGDGNNTFFHASHNLVGDLKSPGK